VPDPSRRPSYRALLEVPQLGRLIASMQLARIAQSMVGVAIVLFALDEYDSPALAGIVTFASIAPGLLISPIAGALLDRQGRVKLMILDYLVEVVAFVLIGVLALADMLPAWLLIIFAIVVSMTGMLSVAGLRSLFPMLVPKHLWERVNAVDSNGYVVATILGPPIAAALVAFIGAPVALIAIGASFLLAAVALVGVHDPSTPPTGGSLLGDSWAGLRYTFRNPTLRGLGFSVSVMNLTGGMATIVIPLLVVAELGYSPAVVGLVYAVSGVSGMVSTFFFGRFDTRGREWPMLVVPSALWVVTVLLLVPAAGLLGPIEPAVALGFIVLSQVIIGLLAGPYDIAMFTVRQRRTDPAMLGRAFAVSMAFNFMGYPVGSAIAGNLAAESIGPALAMGAVASVVGAALGAVLVPRTAPMPGTAVASPAPTGPSGPTSTPVRPEPQPLSPAPPQVPLPTDPPSG
jgi:MFS family permease